MLAFLGLLEVRLNSGKSSRVCIPLDDHHLLIPIGSGNNMFFRTENIAALSIEKKKFKMKQYKQSFNRGRGTGRSSSA